MKRRAMLCAAMLGMLLLGGCLGDTRGREGRDAAERNETETAEMQKTQRSAGEPKALEEQKEADAPRRIGLDISTAFLERQFCMTRLASAMPSFTVTWP